MPNIKRFEGLVLKDDMEDNIDSAQECKDIECKKVWSVSKNNFTYIRYTMDEALSKCSSDFLSKINDSSNSLKNMSADSLQKTKNVFVELCMERKGYKY